MSYDHVNPTYYQTFQQGTPFHAGAPGWTKAPFPTWGDNPNMAGRRRLATDGLGRVVAISGLGADPTPAPFVPPPPSAYQTPAAPVSPLPVMPPWWRMLSIASSAACAYHGYKRNNESIGWTLGWAFFGSALPILALPIALAQGFGKPKKQTPNRRRGSRRRR